MSVTETIGITDLSVRVAKGGGKGYMNTVLIVEDEKMIRQGIRAIVQRSGVPVQNIMECNNGQLALEILQSQPVDVMFTDIRMPKMTGIELVEAMQQLAHKPLTVAISGYDDFTYAVQMMRMGVREYILKPIEGSGSLPS